MSVYNKKTFIVTNSWRPWIYFHRVCTHRTHGFNF